MLRLHRATHRALAPSIGWSPVRARQILATVALACVAALSSMAVGCATGGNSTSANAGDATGEGENGSCSASATCEHARDLGSLPGDGDGGATIVTNGTQSDWLLLHVTETNSDWSGQPLRIRATLANPPGAVFALRAYGNLAERAPDGGAFGDGGPGVDCVDQVGASSASDFLPALDLEWGEAIDGGSANGLDDSRTIAVRVAHVSGGCSGDWTLTVNRR